jgi:multiple sugar transport system permease protein
VSREALEHIQTAVAYTFLGLLLIFVLFPFYWMTVTSFKTEDQMRSLVSMFWPSPFVVENYTQLLTKTDFAIWYRNSAFVAVSSTFVATAVGTIGAYALARLRFLGRAFLSSATLITYLVPPSILFIPLYAQIRAMGLADSLAGLIAAYPSFTVPFVTWLLMGYFGSIPEELEEAAMIDGATRFGAFRLVAVPAIRPALAVTALFAVMSSWNEFILASTLLSRETSFTLPVVLQRYVGEYDAAWGPFAAGSILVSLPVMGIFYVLQRHLVAGLTSGAVKG